MIELIIAGIFLIVLVLILFYRVAKGPKDMDRLVAFESIIIITAAILVLLGAYFERSSYVDIGIVIGIFGFIGVLLITKYLEGKEQ